MLTHLEDRLIDACSPGATSCRRCGALSSIAHVLRVRTCCHSTAVSSNDSSQPHAAPAPEQEVPQKLLQALPAILCAVVASGASLGDESAALSQQAVRDVLRQLPGLSSLFLRSLPEACVG